MTDNIVSLRPKLYEAKAFNAETSFDQWEAS